MSNEQTSQVMMQNKDLHHCNIPLELAETEQPVKENENSKSNNEKDKTEMNVEVMWREEAVHYQKLFDKLADIRETSLETQKELTELSFQAASCLTNIKQGLAKYKLYNLLLSEDNDEVVDLPEISDPEYENKSGTKLHLEDINM